MNDMILILDGSREYGMEIAARLRAEQVCACMAEPSMTAQKIAAFEPCGVILCGEDCCDTRVIAEIDVPVLAIGQAAYGLLSALGGAKAGVAISTKKAQVAYGRSALFTGVADGERFFGEAHTLMLPADVCETASAGGCTIAFEDTEKKKYGVQFELERNDPEGSAILMNFVMDICGCQKMWTMENALERTVNSLSPAAAQGSHAVCAVSGGVDSAVCALLAHRAFGDKMTAIFVDTGLMREGEADDVQKALEALEIPLRRVDCSGEILKGLKGKRSMEDKHAVVAACLHEELLRQSASIDGHKTLLLGTNYNDFLQSGSGADAWQDSGMTVVEPLMTLLKDEVREIGRMLGMSEALVSRKPFPALGLGARIVGEVTEERLQALRTAERIFREEIEQAGMERKLYKHFPVLVGGETLGNELMVLRAVTLSGSMLVPARLPYDLVERTVAQILKKLPTVARVFYDQTPSQIGQESFY